MMVCHINTPSFYVIKKKIIELIRPNKSFIFNTFLLFYFYSFLSAFTKIVLCGRNHPRHYFAKSCIIPAAITPNNILNFDGPYRTHIRCLYCFYITPYTFSIFGCSTAIIDSVSLLFRFYNG